MRFIYDFDGTLYATKKLWEIWRNELHNTGLNLDLIDQTGDELARTGFSCPGHATMLGLIGENQEQVLRRYRERWAHMSPGMLFPDVIPFVSSNPHEQLILTFGDRGHQEEKLNTSGIRTHIPDIRLASPENPKRKQIQEMVEMVNTPIVFIDDNPKELAAVHDAGLPVDLYRMIREDELIADPHPHDNLHWRVVRSLDELQDLL